MERGDIGKYGVYGNEVMIDNLETRGYKSENGHLPKDDIRVFMAARI